MREVVELSQDGSEQLLSVSEYYGVAPRAQVIDAGDHLSRAESLEGYKKCAAGDLVMNIMLAWKRALGVTDFDGIVSPAYAVFRPENSRLSPRFAHYFFRSDTLVSEFRKLSTGVIDSRLRLYPEVFVGMTVHIPAVEDQERIANFLDEQTARIDALIAEKESLLERLESAVEAHAFHLVTEGSDGRGVSTGRAEGWLARVPSHWTIPKLGYFAEVGNGATPKREVEGYWLNGTIPWVTSTAINDRVIASTAECVTDAGKSAAGLKLVRAGSTIVGLIGQGPTRGMAAKLAIEATVSQNVAYVSSRDPGLVSDEYLVVVLTGLYTALRYLSDGSGGAQGAMNCETLRAFRVPIAPRHEQQALVAAFVERKHAIEAMQKHAFEHIARLREYRSSLISAAVTGQLNLDACGSVVP